MLCLASIGSTPYVANQSENGLIGENSILPIAKVMCYTEPVYLLAPQPQNNNDYNTHEDFYLPVAKARTMKNLFLYTASELANFTGDIPNGKGYDPVVFCTESCWGPSPYKKGETAIVAYRYWIFNQCGDPNMDFRLIHERYIETNSNIDNIKNQHQIEFHRNEILSRTGGVSYESGETVVAIKGLASEQITSINFYNKLLFSYNKDAALLENNTPWSKRIIQTYVGPDEKTILSSPNDPGVVFHPTMAMSEIDLIYNIRPSQMDFSNYYGIMIGNRYNELVSNNKYWKKYKYLELPSWRFPHPNQINYWPITTYKDPFQWLNTKITQTTQILDLKKIHNKIVAIHNNQSINIIGQKTKDAPIALQNTSYRKGMCTLSKNAQQSRKEIREKAASQNQFIQNLNGVISAESIDRKLEIKNDEKVEPSSESEPLPKPDAKVDVEPEFVQELTKKRKRQEGESDYVPEHAELLVEQYAHRQFMETENRSSTINRELRVENKIHMDAIKSLKTHDADGNKDTIHMMYEKIVTTYDQNMCKTAKIGKVHQCTVKYIEERKTEIADKLRESTAEQIRENPHLAEKFKENPSLAAGNMRLNLGNACTFSIPNLSPYGNMVIKKVMNVHRIILCHTTHREYLLVEISSLDACRFDWGLHFNVCLSGIAEAGKSFLLLSRKQLMIEGTCESISSMSKQSHAGQGEDNDKWRFMEELPSGWLGNNGKQNDKDLVNRLKDLLTSNKVTHKSNKQVKGGDHILHDKCQEMMGSWAGGTNYTSGIDQAVRTRFIMVSVLAAVSDLEHQKQILVNLENEQNPYFIQLQKQERDRHALIFHTEKMIECRILPQVTDMTARVLLKTFVSTLGKLGVSIGSSRDYRKLYIACRNQAVQYAVHMAFNSELSTLGNKQFSYHDLLETAPWLFITEDQIFFTVGLTREIYLPQIDDSLRTYFKILRNKKELKEVDQITRKLKQVNLPKSKPIKPKTKLKKEKKSDSESEEPEEDEEEGFDNSFDENDEESVYQRECNQYLQINTYQSGLKEWCMEHGPSMPGGPLADDVLYRLRVYQRTVMTTYKPHQVIIHNNRFYYAIGDPKHTRPFDLAYRRDMIDAEAKAEELLQSKKFTLNHLVKHIRDIKNKLRPYTVAEYKKLAFKPIMCIREPINLTCVKFFPKTGCLWIAKKFMDVSNRYLFASALEAMCYSHIIPRRVVIGVNEGIVESAFKTHTYGDGSSNHSHLFEYLDVESNPKNTLIYENSQDLSEQQRKLMDFEPECKDQSQNIFLRSAPKSHKVEINMSLDQRTTLDHLDECVIDGSNERHKVVFPQFTQSFIVDKKQEIDPEFAFDLSNPDTLYPDILFLEEKSQQKTSLLSQSKHLSKARLEFLQNPNMSLEQFRKSYAQIMKPISSSSISSSSSSSSSFSASDMKDISSAISFSKKEQDDVKSFESFLPPSKKQKILSQLISSSSVRHREENEEDEEKSYSPLSDSFTLNRSMSSSSSSDSFSLRHSNSNSDSEGLDI